ncbi:MAG TPA: type II toxin-antitoxin system RelE/ParE family toxin [Thermodesulfovibrionales bacterium]|nr:type II toxin-antitoxin system RelE/ParE family toxin [Thermodesulfovibrionales bacterium]
MYKVTFLPDAEASFGKLDKPMQGRIAEKIDWLAENADKVIHHLLKSMPDDLKGLCRIRIGDYRIIYWVYNEEKHIKIYEIEHRSKDYRSIRK